MNTQLAMISHLVKSYADWWGVDVQVSGENGWTLEATGVQGLERLLFPRNDAMLVPNAVQMMRVWVGGVECDLPYPGTAVENDFCREDLLTFLCGQLWRAEELESKNLTAASHADDSVFLGERFQFFDKPIVDLWMRFLLETLHGRLLQSPQGFAGNSPKFWMTYDVDCLRKWKTRSVVKHLLHLPLDLAHGKTASWWKLTREAWCARDPKHDPWYTIPQMLAQHVPKQSTIFFLGHARDHLAFRYDVQREEYATLLKSVVAQGRQLGLHGSPLHANDAQALNKEKTSLENITATKVRGHRQHYLRIVPGETFRLLDSMGIEFDSTLGFNHRVGFRTGSCIPIAWWDLQNGRALKMLEIPLLVGDWTLHNPEHFLAKDSHAKICQIAAWTRLAGGILTLDFHELYFAQEYFGHAEFHDEMLATLAAQGFAAWCPETRHE